MNIRRIYTWFNRVVGTLVILLVITGVSFYFWIHSENGWRWLAKQIDQATDGNVQLINLSGDLPFYIQAGSLTLYGADQSPWLVATNLHVRMSMKALTRRAFVVRTFSAESINLLHVPVRDSTEKKTPAPADRSPAALPLREGRIESLHIDQFRISSNVFGVTVLGSVQGVAGWQQNGMISGSLTSDVFVQDEIPLSLAFSATFDTGQRILSISALSASNQWDHAHGSGLWQLNSGSMSAEARLAVSEVARYAVLHRQNVSGSVGGSLAVSRVNTNHTYHIRTELNALALHHPRYQAEEMYIKGDASWLGRTFDYRAEMQAGTFHVDNWLLREASLTIKGASNRHELTIATSGMFDRRIPFSTSANLTVDVSDETNRYIVTFDTMKANWSDVVFDSQTAATIDITDSTARLNVPAARINNAALSLNAAMQEWKMNALKLRLEAFDIDHLSRFTGPHAPRISGVANLDITLLNLLTEPNGTLQMDANDVTMAYGILHHFDNAALVMDAQLNTDGITALSRVSHPLLDRFEASFDIPVAATNALFPLMLKWEHGVGLRVRLNGNLREISESMVTRPMAIGGYVSMDIAAEGFPHRPEFQGYFHLTNGQFRGLETGTFIDNIDVRLTGEHNQLKLDHATARDGGRGRIAATGHVAFAENWQTDWLLHATVTNATIFRVIRTDLPLSGDVRGYGNRDSSRVEGDLWLEPFKFVIPRRLPPRIRELDVIEINHPDPNRNTPTNADHDHTDPKNDSGHSVELDIRVSTRRGFEVVGRGLQSEWRGNMHLTGSSLDPRLIGSIRVARGYAMLLGRRFNMDEGQIELGGPIPPNPRIMVSASTRISDITARIEVGGTVNQPEIRLRSDPLLPEDEIMAVILFGKSLETMTPWQAIALANGLRILSGSGGDVINVMESSQSLIQVDQIDIKQDEEGEGFSSVVVGKYIGHNLYVEGEKGFGDAEDSITVTLELTPRLSLETETSPRIREGISLQWRREF